MAQKSTSTAPPSVSSAIQDAKSRFIAAFRREHATTLKVLRAFPPAQSGFRPHERSNTAHQLAWTFVAEERIMLKALRGEQIVGSSFPKPPETWNEVLEALVAEGPEVVKELERASPALIGGQVKFYTGPKQVGDIPMMDFLSFMLFDQIHHRGQLSVYVRMAGGKVPSIYGPSADEPWT